eukprot:838558_1
MSHQPQMSSRLLQSPSPDTNTANMEDEFFSPTAPSPQQYKHKSYWSESPPLHHTTTNRIRSIAEVKSYLEHFIPELTPLTILTCLIIKPILIFVNVFFIGYQFFWFLFSNNPFGTGVPSPWNRALQIVVVSFEFFGLIVLILTACIAAYKNYFSVMTECIRLMGSWSVFRLFYRLRPLALFEYLSVLSTHNLKRVEKHSAKIDKWKHIVSDLDDEIAHCPSYTQYNLFGIDVNKMRRTKENLLRLIDIQEALPNKSRSHSHSNYHSFLVYISTWFVVITLLFIALFVGVLSLVLKLSMFSYVGQIDTIATWTPTQWFLFLFFVNQIWNINDMEMIQITTIYRFLYVDYRVKYTRYVSQRMCMLDSVIKEELFKSHGYRGLLLAICLNSELLQKILIKPEYELNTEELIQYQQIVDSRTSRYDARLNHNSYGSEFDVNPLNNELYDYKQKHTSNGSAGPPQLERIVSGRMFQEDEEFKSFQLDCNQHNAAKTDKEPMLYRLATLVKSRLTVYENWLRMSAKHPPCHPYANAKKELRQFANKMDSMSKKVFIVTGESAHPKCDNTVETYCEYKLMACKENHSGAASAMSLISIDTAAFINTLDTGNDAVMMEGTKGFIGNKHTMYYLNIRENVLMHKIVLFEYLERFLSMFGPFLLIVITVMAILTTIVSILNPNAHKNTIAKTNKCGNSVYTPTIYMDWTYLVLSMSAVACIIIYIMKIVSNRWCKQSQPLTRSKQRRYHTRTIAVIIVLWLSMTIVSWMRFVYYLFLNRECKRAIMLRDPSVFASVVSDGTFALLMSAVVVIGLMLHYVILLVLVHFSLLFLFYWFGYSFVSGIVSEATAFLLHNTKPVDDATCQLRMYLSVVTFLLLLLYLLLSVIEIVSWHFRSKHPRSYTRLNTQSGSTSDVFKDDPIVLDNMSHTLRSNQSISRSPPKITQSLPEFPTLQDASTRPIFIDRTGSIWSSKKTTLISNDRSNKSSTVEHILPIRNWLKANKLKTMVMIIFYIVATFHFFFALIVSNVCVHLHYDNAFCIIMWMDLLLFAKLFRSYDILFDPIFWSVGMLRNYVNN